MKERPAAKRRAFALSATPTLDAPTSGEASYGHRGKEAQRSANCLGRDTEGRTSMPDKRTTKLTDYLLARGWRRSDEPAAFIGECGASSDTVGYCEKSARWEKDGVRVCAQHAAQGERFREAVPPPQFPALDELPDPEASWALRNTTR